MSDQVSRNNGGASLVNVRTAKDCIKRGVYERPHNMDVIGDICTDRLTRVLERGHIKNRPEEKKAA